MTVRNQSRRLMSQEASGLPYAYIYHDASATLNTALVVNVASEIDINGGSGKQLNLFTNASDDASCTYTGDRSFKALVQYDMAFRSSGTSSTVEFTVRNDGAATNTGEFAQHRMLSGETNETTVSRIIDIANGDVIAPYVENVTGSTNIQLHSLLGTIMFLGWL